MTRQIDHTRIIPGSYIFDGRASRQGYRLNKLCLSLAKPENRDRFREDEAAYMDEWELSDEHKELIAARDFLGLIRTGGNIYMLIKLGATVGEGLYHMGAQQRGESYEEFLATRNASGAR
jgi:protocatechuate 4,5-dioxygenase, alpha chain